jgi:hypothetical protein
VRAHLAGEDDSLVSVRPVLDRWGTSIMSMENRKKKLAEEG